MDEKSQEKDKLIHSDQKASDELMEETIVFKREPEPITQQRPHSAPNSPPPRSANPPAGMNSPKSAGAPKSSNPPRVNPSQQHQSMQNTAKIQGGAVIRPLKRPAQSPSNPQQQALHQPQQLPQQQQALQQPQQQPQLQQNPKAAQPMQQPSKLHPQTSASQPGTSALPKAMMRASQPTSQSAAPKSGAPNPGAPNPGAPKAAHPAAPITGAQKPGYPASQKPAAAHSAPQNAPQNAVVPHTTAMPDEAPSRMATGDFEIDEELTGRTPRKRRRTSAAADSASSAIMSLVKAIIYIVAVIAVSVALSIFVIVTANDVFAFVKEERVVEVTIPEYATIEDIAEILHEEGVIEYPWAFVLWGNLKDKKQNFIPGTYEVSTTLNYDYLRGAFKKSATREEVRITIREGMTVDEIIALFVGKGIGTKEGFADVIQNYEFDFPFLTNLLTTDDRIWRLEGYLFPDTYDFYADASEVDVIYKLLQNFNRKFIEEYYARCTELGLTVDEAIILASMIEKEARFADDLGNVSSVFHNRLKYSATFPCMESDATIMYAIQHDTGSRPETMTGSDTDYETPYNTYKYRGLPPGPIANPGLNSIRYALYPNDSNYFFFVSDSSGDMYYAETGKEHDQNIILARSK